MGHASTSGPPSDAVTRDGARVQPPPVGDPAGAGSPGTLDSMTELMIAAAGGDEATIELLLLSGADPARRDVGGRTAAAYARVAGHPHLAARLDTVVDKERTIR